MGIKPLHFDNKKSMFPTYSVKILSLIGTIISLAKQNWIIFALK